MSSSTLPDASPLGPGIMPTARSGTWYFLTLIIHQREPLLGQVSEGKLALTPAGLEVARAWKYSAAIRKEIHLGPWMVMPDHFHALVRVSGPLAEVPTMTRSALFRAPRIPGPLGSLIAGFKMGSSREVNRIRGTPRMRLWRRGVLYRLVPPETLEATAKFILENPRQWLKEHP
ncbi:MAG TPA: hypothetical protein VG817_02405 [Gemmatimonadales bacterium]|nr:hypothetical protein [Gemmatimonadales bacterium]